MKTFDQAVLFPCVVPQANIPRGCYNQLSSMAPKSKPSSSPSSSTPPTETSTVVHDDSLHEKHVGDHGSPQARQSPGPQEEQIDKKTVAAPELPQTQQAVDIEHVFVQDDPRKWSNRRKVNTVCICLLCGVVFDTPLKVIHFGHHFVSSFDCHSWVEHI